MDALDVLSSFDFGDLDLLSFAQEHICQILAEDPTCKVRGAAAATCIRIAKNQTPASEAAHSESVLAILETLLMHGVSDPKECVRFAIWDALLASPELDAALLSCDATHLLYIGLGDASLLVLSTALKLAGRLIGSGGDFLQDAVVEVLSQLLQQLDLSFDKERNQTCTEILGQVIQSCPSVVIPRAGIICKSLIQLLKRQLQPPARSEPSDAVSEERTNSVTWLKERFSWTSTGVVAAALQTAGHLADQAGASIDAESLQTLLELTVAALQKVEIEKDSIEAVRTLGKIVSSTGAVAQPYHKFSWLLLRLLDMLQVDDPEVRTAVTRTLGILCAIDPGRQRRIQAQASGEGRLELEGVRPAKKAPEKNASTFSHGQQLDKGSTDLLMISKVAINSEESYSLFAMHALLKIVKQHSLSAFHRDAIYTLGQITSSLSASSVQYLNLVQRNHPEKITDCLLSSWFRIGVMLCMLAMRK